MMLVAIHDKPYLYFLEFRTWSLKFNTSGRNKEIEMLERLEISVN